MGVHFIAGTNPSSSNRGLETEDKKVLFPEYFLLWWWCFLFLRQSLELSILLPKQGKWINLLFHLPVLQSHFTLLNQELCWNVCWSPGRVLLTADWLFCKLRWNHLQKVNGRDHIISLFLFHMLQSSAVTLHEWSCSCSFPRLSC